MDSPTPVRIPAGSVVLDGLLDVPAEAAGIVLFAHGSGSSRLSPRNAYVARELRRAGIGTLLFDLLTAEESADRALVFDVDFLARRLRAATRWVRGRSGTEALRVGYFGASTGAAAALIAAADDAAVAAVVSRGGRPDLAAPLLPRVQAPTLLVVGGDDAPVIALNEDALRRLRCEKRLVVVPGATHLFEEPGALEEVVRLATDWFRDHFRRPPRGETHVRTVRPRTGREPTMPILTNLREFLDANRVTYEVRSHRTAFTAQEVAAAEHIPGREMAKVVMVRDGREYLMTVLPAPEHLDLERLEKATGRTGLRIATEAQFAGLFPGCEPGAMPPFGNLYGLPVWVDESLTRDDEIAFNAGNHEQTVHMRYADFARLVQPRVAALRVGAPGRRTA